MINTSDREKIALIIEDIATHQNVISRKINELKHIYDPPKENPEPKYWLSVDETAKQQFNKTDDYLFRYMENLGWIYRSHNQGDWLIYNKIIQANWLKHKPTELKYGRPYGQIMISEFGIQELLRKGVENGKR
jgi:hypothetical protein